MTDKALALHALQELPEDASMETICEKLDFILAVREGIGQADRDEGITLEEWTQKLAPELMAERNSFLKAIQEGIDQLDRDEGIRHEEVRKNAASWLTA